ncbi:Aminodeoxychorismate lyase [Serratia plymuthica]|uniref:Aminodeoxychorismate lyase n=1 Tax=Serratia plymuthica TaxID=82996 RepID=A0A2X4UF91_SERPL|nr:Aminodeoxychorismate lyase [Serratia plymuthica]
MYWINGQQHDALAPSDRGLQFGDGCFTTARVIDGRIELLPWHIERLQQAAQRLMMPLTDWGALESEMARAAESIPLGVVKAILTRGSGGRGYSPQGVKILRALSLAALIPRTTCRGVNRASAWRSARWLWRVIRCLRGLSI